MIVLKANREPRTAGKNLKKLLFLLVAFFSFLSAAETICSPNAGNTALVVIDMQPYFSNRINGNSPANQIKIQNIIKEQIATIKKAREANIPIIFLEYDGLPSSNGEGETNAALKAAAGNYKDVKYFKKTSDGMFESYNKYRQGLIDYLKQKSVGKLIITGANGGACVFQSIEGSLEGNCSVVAYNKGIADFNFKDFIYPYVGQYNDVFSGHKFNEVSNIDDVAQEMLGSSNGSGSTANLGSAAAAH